MSAAHIIDTHSLLRAFSGFALGAPSHFRDIVVICVACVLFVLLNLAPASQQAEPAKGPSLGYVSDCQAGVIHLCCE